MKGLAIEFAITVVGIIVGLMVGKKIRAMLQAGGAPISGGDPQQVPLP